MTDDCPTKKAIDRMKHVPLNIGGWISIKRNPPKKDGMYVVWGNCEGDGHRPHFAKWRCGEFGVRKEQPTHYIPYEVFAPL